MQSDADPHTETGRGAPATALESPLFSAVRQRAERRPPAAAAIAVPPADAFSVIVQLRDFASNKLWRSRRLIYAGGHLSASVSITHLADEYACQHLSAFDNVRFQIGREQFDELADDVAGRRLGGLDTPLGDIDPVVHGLTQALLPSLAAPGQADRFFVEHVMAALGAHLARRYGRLPARPAAPACLAAWQERRAKQYMQAHLGHTLSLAQVAAQCGLSRSHFARRFKQSTGLAPFEWLRRERVERAKALLRAGDVTLASIASDCGFSDQSHFTRVFTRLAGLGPAAWRQSMRRDTQVVPRDTSVASDVSRRHD